MAVLTPLQGILFLKTLIDGSASVGFLVTKDPPMALMFMGFAVADLATVVMAVR